MTRVFVTWCGVQIQCSDVTDGRTDGHITTAKPALVHGVYGSKTIMIRENDTGFWYTVLRADTML